MKAIVIEAEPFGAIGLVREKKDIIPFLLEKGRINEDFTFFPPPEFDEVSVGDWFGEDWAECLKTMDFKEFEDAVCDILLFTEEEIWESDRN